MLKRCLAAVLCLWLLCSCAFAEEYLATYMMPEGAQVYYLPMGEEPEIPKGLEAMYALMQSQNCKGDLYLLQMKNGRVLFSISGMPAKRDLTAQEMLEMWPRIAADLALQPGVLSLDSSSACAQVDTLGGMEVLHIRTSISCEDDLALIAEGYAFCADGGVTELWALYPSLNIHVDEPLAEGLESDLADLQSLLDSLVFPGGSTQMLQSVDYADPKGRFRMAIPADSTVLTGASSADERAALKERFVQNNPEGADRVFDRFTRQLDSVDSTLVFTQDMQGILRVTATPEQCLAGVQPEGLITMAPTFEEVFSKEFDLAFCLQDDERALISGENHALMGYWLRMGDMDVQLDLMLCVHPADWMYEVDLYVAEGNQQLRSELYAYVLQTLVYTPPVNALD